MARLMQCLNPRVANSDVRENKKFGTNSTTLKYVTQLKVSMFAKTPKTSPLATMDDKTLKKTKKKHG